MNEPLIHPGATAQFGQLTTRPPHALLLLAPPGAGKGTLARLLAASLLGVGKDKLDNYPYFRFLGSMEGKSISIESVRDIIHFLTLRTPGNGGVSRVVVIENAGQMTTQAQNALLKTIEEPPAGTVLILTASSELDILPTIRSRVQAVTMKLPTTGQLKDYFIQAGYSSAAVDKALMMSDGLPGMTHALLADDNDHPLVLATERARTLLQKTTFERLLLIDELVKQKQAWLDTLFIIQRVAEINLQRAGSSADAMKRWHAVLAASNDAYGKTLTSAQTKLVALNFILSI